MAYIYSRMGHKYKAIEFFEKGIKYHPFDIEFLIEYTIFLDSYEVDKAFHTYQKIQELLSRTDLKEKYFPIFLLAPHFYNNIALTYMKKGKYSEALQFLETGITKVNSQNENGVPAQTPANPEQKNSNNA